MSWVFRRPHDYQSRFYADYQQQLLSDPPPPPSKTYSKMFSVQGPWATSKYPYASFAGKAPTGGLFMNQGKLDGMGTGGPFFRNPIG